MYIHIYIYIHIYCCQNADRIREHSMCDMSLKNSRISAVEVDENSLQPLQAPTMQKQDGTLRNTKKQDGALECTC